MELKSRDYFPFFTDKSSSLLETVLDCSASLVPLWVAVLVGLFVGWIWKPRWVSLLFFGIRSRPRLVWTSPPGLGARRFWFALTASVTAFQMFKECWLKFQAWRWPQTQLEHASQERDAASSPLALDNGNSSAANMVALDYGNSSAANMARAEVGDEDLRDLHRRFHYKDGGLSWEFMMKRSIPGMTYQAWRRDPQRGPTEYRSCTVFEDATPEMMKDFFWDDEFRHEWDDMILYAKSLTGCTETGAEIVHWVRKFPFFCSDREYLIGRRIYESGGTFFCITKGVPYSAVPRQKKPRRVDVYYSSWCVRAVESPQTGQTTACEVTFLHSEDMGIQRDIAKLGVRQGMWNCVKKMEPGLRKYQAHRKSSRTLSHSASMAQLVMSIPTSFFEDSDVSAATVWRGEANGDPGRHQRVKGWKWLVVGGAVVLACGLDRGVVGRVIVFGVAKRLSKLGRRL